MAADPWSGIYGAIIGAVVGGIVSSLVAYRLARADGIRKRIDDVSLALAKAIERYKLAAIYDHWQLINRRPPDPKEYEAASSDVQIAIIDMRSILSEQQAQATVEAAQRLQTYFNRALEVQNLAIDDLVRAQQGASGMIIETRDVQVIKDDHARVQAESVGFVENALLERARAMNAARDKIPRWWQIWS